MLHKEWQFSWSGVNKWQNKYRITISKQTVRCKLFELQLEILFWCWTIYSVHMYVFEWVFMILPFLQCSSTNTTISTTRTTFSVGNGFAIDTNAFAKLLWCFWMWPIFRCNTIICSKWPVKLDITQHLPPLPPSLSIEAKKNNFKPLKFLFCEIFIPFHLWSCTL